MLKEFVNIYCMGYLYTSLLLLPVYCFYFIIDGERFPMALMHRIHKWILLLTMLFPLIFTALMFLSGPNESVSVTGRLQPVHTLSAETMGLPGKILIDDRSMQPVLIDNFQTYHQIALGVFYYLTDFLACMIMAGLIMFLLRMAIQKSYVNYVERNSRKSKINNGYHIFISNKITLPFSIGLRFKRIYLPDGLVNEDMNIILNHEQNHFKKYHHYWSLLESLAHHLFWFNPVSGIMRKRGILFREMECDTDTITTIDKYIYSRTLLKTAESMVSSGRLGLMVQQWIQKGVLKKRLENILNGENSRKQRFISLGFYLTLTLSAGIFIFVSLLDDDSLERNLVIKATAQYATILETTGGVSIKDVPDHLVRVLMFNEDSGFYDHGGVSLKAFLRAMVNNLSGGPLQGGSTITQQLSKRLCMPDSQRTLGRKLKQVKAARVLEKHFNKNQILEMYLNSVYFGQGAYGVDMASRKFFNHPASGLTIAESAMLIQSLGSPRNHNYIANPELVVKRTLRLLNRMVNHDLLDENDVEQSMASLNSWVYSTINVL